MPEKSQNMKPAISSTAAGSKMTVYLPAGISRGWAVPAALTAAISANAKPSKSATFGELAFCHPEESSPSIVMEISDDVWVCHCDKPWELKIPSNVLELEKIPAAVSLCFSATATIF